MPAPGPVGHLWAPGPQDRPALCVPTDLADWRRSAHRQATGPAGGLVRRRRPRRGRSHLDDVSAHRGRLPTPRPQDRPHHDGRADHHAEHRRPQSPAGGDHPRTHTQEAGRRRPGLLRTGPAHPTGRPRRSTAVWSTSEDPPWDSVTSPTTSPDRYWKPADSNPNYTVIHEEPDFAWSLSVVPNLAQGCNTASRANATS